MKYENLFSSNLLAWNKTQNTRKMPWKGEKDPYKIWISEIILQQTRVQQGINYYERFIKTFPDVKSLATSSQKKIYKLWEGLGYYSRCKNLIETAKFIHKNLNDKFPEKYQDILALKGIGNYTASAIASFAYDKPYAVLDGNVFRVLSRFFGIETPIQTSEGKKMFGQLSQRLLDKKKPSDYNQAIMDFGAVVCKPLLPLCRECPLQKRCVAFINNKTNCLPVNKKKIKQKERFFNYLIIEYKNKFYAGKRTQKDIWQNLYEFILIETGFWQAKKEILRHPEFLSIVKENEYAVKHESRRISQKLTHQHVTGHFILIEVKKPIQKSKSHFLVSKKQLLLLPLPKLITSYFADKNVPLNLST
jgi:A/G-specific adenine glycosylase